MDDSRLPRSAPREQDVDAAGLLTFLDAVEAAADVEMHSLMLLRHGRVVAEGWWAPYTAERVHLLYSLSKSFTSAALGLAVAEGLVALDDRVSRHLPMPHGAAHDPRLRDLAVMASGHTWDTWSEVESAIVRVGVDPVAAFLGLPPDGEPGTTFAYNQACTYTLAAVLQRVAGQTLTAYLRPRLLDPLGIGEVAWQRLAGRELGFSGLHARTEDVARLGLLHLHDGRWDGRRLLPPGWVAEATRPHVATEQDGKPDWSQGYGYQFWTARHGYRGDGAYGQFCVVLPEQDVVLAATGASPDMQAVLDAVWTHVLPACDGPGAADREHSNDALAERLRGLVVAPVTGAAHPDDPARWHDARLAVEPGADVPPGLRAVVVERRPDAWWLRLEESDGALIAALGTDGWATTEEGASAGGTPVATSGAWQPDGSLEVVVRPLEWPHAVRLRLDPAGAATAVWTTAPLHPAPLSRAGKPAPS